MSNTTILPSIQENGKTFVPVLRLDLEIGLCRTSKYLPLADAKRLCQRLANLSNVLNPMVVNVRKDGTARVQWQPLTPGSMHNDLAIFIAQREATAAEQSGVMSFHATAGFQQYACINEDGHGTPHLVDLANHECDCGDYRYRCMTLSARYGIPVPCHHLIELSRRLDAGEPLVIKYLPQPVPVRVRTPEARAVRAERVSANLGRDF
jgi:hypothetical protein